jgi:4-oxalocrotonate tautomerase
MVPFVRISLREGTTPEYRKAIAEGVQQAMMEAIAVPAADRFQIITEHKPDDMIYEPSYLGINRSDKACLFKLR